MATCRDHLANIVDDLYCRSDEKPDESQQCQDRDCADTVSDERNHKWKTSAWTTVGLTQTGIDTNSAPEQDGVATSVPFSVTLSTLVVSQTTPMQTEHTTVANLAGDPDPLTGAQDSAVTLADGAAGLVDVVDGVPGNDTVVQSEDDSVIDVALPISKDGVDSVVHDRTGHLMNGDPGSVVPNHTDQATNNDPGLVTHNHSDQVTKGDPGSDQVANDNSGPTIQNHSDQVTKSDPGSSQVANNDPGPTIQNHPDQVTKGDPGSDQVKNNNPGPTIQNLSDRVTKGDPGSNQMENDKPGPLIQNLSDQVTKGDPVSGQASNNDPGPTIQTNDGPSSVIQNHSDQVTQDDLNLFKKDDGPDSAVRNHSDPATTVDRNPPKNGDPSVNYDHNDKLDQPTIGAADPTANLNRTSQIDPLTNRDHETANWSKQAPEIEPKTAKPNTTLPVTSPSGKVSPLESRRDDKIHKPNFTRSLSYSPKILTHFSGWNLGQSSGPSLAIRPSTVNPASLRRPVYTYFSNYYKFDSIPIPTPN